MIIHFDKVKRLICVILTLFFVITAMSACTTNSYENRFNKFCEEFRNKAERVYESTVNGTLETDEYAINKDKIVHEHSIEPEELYLDGLSEFCFSGKVDFMSIYSRLFSVPEAQISATFSPEDGLDLSIRVWCFCYVNSKVLEIGNTSINLSWEEIEKTNIGTTEISIDDRTCDTIANYLQTTYGQHIAVDKFDVAKRMREIINDTLYTIEDNLNNMDMSLIDLGFAGINN